MANALGYGGWEEGQPNRNGASKMTDASNNPRVIVALDYETEKDALDFVSRLDSSLCRLKVGKELFTSTGRSFVEKLVEKGFDVFLDMKFHDIPNTVAGAVKAAARMGVWMVNVHASGSREMMVAAREAVDAFKNPPLLIAVTVLTSMDDEDLKLVGVECPVEEQVLRLAKLTENSGLDGVVCSAREVQLLKGNLGKDFVYVTPGIRLADSKSDDQKRVVTPKKALADGSTYLVMGRPIRQAEDPNALLRDIADGRV